MNPQATSEDRVRQAHVVLDAPSRVLKAKKIIALVGPERFARAKRVLEIGCGSGVIAQTLAELGGPGLQVFAVDVADNRLVHDGYAFTRVESTALPFGDYQFDIVITNHVIEHVGNLTNQVAHLCEIRRVLALDGLAYLAVPNRWRLVEPHFRLPLLSWFPRGIADRYIRMARKGTYYDCLPLSLSGAHAMFQASGFSTHEVTIEAFRVTLDIEFCKSNAFVRIMSMMPDNLIRLFKQAMPTFVFLLHRPL